MELRFGPVRPPLPPPPTRCTTGVQPRDLTCDAAQRSELVISTCTCVLYYSARVCVQECAPTVIEKKNSKPLVRVQTPSGLALPHPYTNEAARLNERARPHWSITLALSSPDYRPGCTLLTGGCTVGKRGGRDGRGSRALPYPDDRTLLSSGSLAGLGLGIGHAVTCRRIWTVVPRHVTPALIPRPACVADTKPNRRGARGGEELDGPGFNSAAVPIREISTNFFYGPGRRVGFSHLYVNKEISYMSMQRPASSRPDFLRSTELSDRCV